MTIVQRLAILVAVVVLPVLAFAGQMVLHYARAAQTIQQIQMQADARALTLAVDREIALQQTVATVLGGSDSLARGDLRRFYDRAVQVLGDDADRRVMLIDRDGDLLLNTKVPFGAALPPSALTPAIQEVVRTGKPLVTDFTVGAVTKTQVLGVLVPTFEDGITRYVVGVGFSPQRLSNLLAAQRLPDGWIASIVDREGIVIGSSRDAGGFVGHPAPDDILRAIAASHDGLGELATGDESPSIEFAHVHSAMSGWSITMSVEQSALDAPLNQALRQIAVGGTALLLLACGLAVVYGRTISRPIVALAAAAAALGRGERMAPATLGIKEAQRVADAIDAAADMIAGRDAERESLLKSLEQRVAERTCELQESEARLRLLATTDALTGLPNRRRFDEVFTIAWRQALRDQSSISLLMIDADCFKSYNDQYGHDAGDGCLRAIAGAIGALVARAGDFAARYGGEEFVMLLQDTDAEGALTVAQRIHAAICELNVPHDGSPMGIATVSIGVATTVPVHLDDRGTLIRAADRNLYAAKHGGRSRIEAIQLV
jgi:diguanylate cyclase (GGDEF)-like protein